MHTRLLSVVSRDRTGPLRSGAAWVTRLLAGGLALVVATAAHADDRAGSAGRFTEQDRQEVKDLFLRQAAAATAHDIVAFEDVFATAAPGQSDPVVLVARAYQLWGKPALLAHFTETFKGVWKFEPDIAQIRIMPLNADVAHLYAPTQITQGANEASARTGPFNVYETAVRTPQGWRIASIAPVPAQPRVQPGAQASAQPGAQ
jgi:hypothetical protein